MKKMLWLLVFALLPAVAHADDLTNENCRYNGMVLDVAMPTLPPGHIRSVPQNFTGLVVCADPQTKRMYETYRMRKGERDGETRTYDRSDGTLTEITPYTAGQRDGVVKHFDFHNGRLQHEFTVKRGQVEGVQKDYESATGVMTRIQYVALDRKVKTSSIIFTKRGQLSSFTCGDQILLGSDAAWCGRNNKPSDVALYDEDGWIRTKQSYLNGQLVSEQVLRKNGELARESHYQNGHTVDEKTYAPGEKKPTTVRARVGDAEMEMEYFEESKKPRHAVERKNGHIEKEINYYANGKMEREVIATDPTHYHVREFNDHGICVLDGGYYEPLMPVWGLWDLVADGAVKSFDDSGHLLEVENFARGTRDGLQISYDEEQPNNVLRRAKYEKGRLRWSEDFVKKSNQTVHREYAEDGSVTSEKTVKGNHPI